MPTEVILPKVDMDMETGTISAWHVAEGEAIEQGEALFDIETDKAAMEVESPASGILHHIIAVEGDKVPIGQTVAWIYSDGEDVPDAPPQMNETPAAPEPPSSVHIPAPSEPLAETAHHNTLRATPAARQLAQRAGLLLADVSGTGPRDRIQKSDVQAALSDEILGLNAPPQVLWDAESAPLNVVKTGSGDATPWLLIHGLAADADAWVFIEKELAASAPVFRLELPCHGNSPRHRVKNFAHLAAYVRKAFDALNVDRARLIGHSLGGALSIALADTRPRNIESLTLLSPAGLGPQINGEILDGIARASTAESLGPWLRLMTANPDLLSENYISAAMMARKDPDLRRAQHALQKAVFPDHTQNFDLTAALHRLTCPTRIIFGKKDQVIPWSHALKAPGNVSLNLFPDVGHLPNFEDPEGVLALL